VTEPGPLPDEVQLATIVHDFNNLLGVIAASAEAARERATQDPALLAELDTVAAAAERGAALVRRLLGVRRPVPTPRVLNLNAALRALMPLLRRALGAGIALDLAEGNPPLAWADPVGFDQAVLNLAANARDAMRGGGRLTLRTGQRDGHGLLEVTDTGEGIAPNLLCKVLQPGVTTKPAGRGFGLGLASVSETMRAAGGSLVIESVLGEGTTVRLLFPPAPVARCAGRLLLLVEDETPVRSLAARALTRRGWEVLATDSAESALTAAESRLADLALVVADLSLPGGDGLGLIRTLRVRRPGLPAILTSGYLTVAAASDEPDLHFLSKPYDMETLAQACAEAVERS